MILAAFLTTSVFGQSSQDRSASDYMRGKEDGRNAVSVSGVWFFAGFGLGPAGVLMAFLIKPSSSPAVFIGKSQDYIKGYTEGYRSKSVSEQSKLALTGMGTACAVFAVIILLMSIFIVEVTDAMLQP